jgi:hypothetical protein
MGWRVTGKTVALRRIGRFEGPELVEKLWHKFLDKRTDVEYRARVLTRILMR